MCPHERGEDPGAASRTAVRLCGLADGTVVCDALDRALERVEEEFLCASGERWGGVWRGIPVAALLDRPDVDVDPAATHVRVAADEYAVCVPIRTALGGVLAVEREGEPPAAGPPSAVCRPRRRRADGTGSPRTPVPATRPGRGAARLRRARVLTATVRTRPFRRRTDYEPPADDDAPLEPPRHRR